MLSEIQHLIWSPLFKGLKVIGQVTAQLFHDQMGVIPSAFYLQVSGGGNLQVWHLESVVRQYKVQRAVAASEASHH